MAKIKSGILSGAQGRIGDVTVYSTGGTTIARKAETNAVDQKTLAQYVQRVIAKTAMDQYSAMQMIANHSFQGIPMGRKSMARFLKLNMNYFRNRAVEIQQQGGSIYDFYQFARVGQTKFIPAAVYLSEGKLPKVTVNIATDGSVAYVSGFDGINSYESVMNLLAAKRGDQVTFITVEKKLSTGDYIFRYARVILDPRTASGAAAPLSTAFTADNEVVQSPNMRNQGSFNLLITTGNDRFSFNIGGDKIAATGIIISRKSKRGWLRSECKLVINEGIIGADLLSLGDAAEQSQTPIDLYVDSEAYLNNAGEGGQVGVITNEDTITGMEVAEVVMINGVSQNVNGGTIYVSDLNSIQVQGRSLTANSLTIEQSGGAAQPEAFTASSDGTSASWSGDVAASSSQQTWVVRLNSNAWFNIVILPEHPGHGQID